MQENITLTRLDGETLEKCLYRLGCLKRNGNQEITWNHITDFLNSEFDLIHGESAYRKRFKRLCKAIAVKELEALYNGDYTVATKSQIRELEKQRLRVQQEKTAYRKQLRQEADWDAMLEEMKNLIQTIDAPDPVEHVESLQNEKAVFAMLSDVHFGLSFQSYYNQYNPEIAQLRVMQYVSRIAEIGRQSKADTVYVALLGDLISGSIHPTIRTENRVNVISQVIGVSELLSAAIAYLSAHFKHVHVANVAGNHSRLDANLENSLRTERMDMLIPWYCKAKLSNIDNVHFTDNSVDPTIAIFEIFNKVYVAVHGDFDNDLKQSALRISQLIGKKIDYFLAGHMHVAEMRIEDVGYIRNGAVVSGGDEYTSKKRLFGPAMQVCMVVSSNGVESIHPVGL